MVKDKWWRAAVELVAGDILVTSDGKEQVVKSVKVEEKGYPVTTYNLTVEDNHTFFISSERILTHNTTRLLKKCDYTKEISESITEGVKKTKFKYKNNPMDNPKSAKDIIENSEAIYGFSPKKGGRLDDFVDMIDWTDAEQVASARAQRIAYHNKMSTNLENKVKKLLEEGYSMEDIAKNMINERNQNRINTYIKNGNYEGLEGMYKSNLKEYGNAEGPTYEYMLKKCGSNEEIINSSIKSNLGMDACTGLYDEYFKGGN